MVQPEAGRLLSPGSRCLVGRADTCTLLLTHRSVSAEHASVFWTDEGWVVRDLGSRNGTFVGDQRLGPGQKAVWKPGLPLRFGGDVAWELHDGGPPGAVAARLGPDGRVDLSTVVPAYRGLLALPDEDDPTVTVRAQGERWLLETDEGESLVDDGHTIEVAGASWRLLVPPVRGDVVATTALGSALQPALQDASLHFAVSADEEHVTLRIVSRGKVFDTKPRTHHYLLLTMARQRLADLDRGVPDTEAGWLHADDLQRMLRMDRRALNTQVFRARRQLAELELDGTGDVIERRDPARQLRIGASNIVITRPGD
jgi:hypothetical protein